ncbi:MAG: dephospho-CoA kinase [Deltaproteobacteria bacterium]|nr:MAG: dephospho-CoA kinase [Deltaproteobacteria bacterium]
MTHTHITLKELQRDTRVLLIGITGGIASGKSTVADMLEELGAPAIDFDVIARKVVEPGKEAWKEIVDYFGPDVLQKDGTLDRKKLSSIIFHDKKKREVLERITHPRIIEEFIGDVYEIRHKNPEVIIQAVIPLLYEVGLQHLVHKVIVVYIPQDKQIERLVKRDNISREEAARILEAQLPIDQKANRADFVIHNERSLAHTRKQVSALWETLRSVQKERLKGENR